MTKEHSEKMQEAVDNLITLIQQSPFSTEESRLFLAETICENSITAAHHYTDEAVADDKRGREEAAKPRKFYVPIDYKTVVYGSGSVVVEATSVEEAAQKAESHDYEDLDWGKEGDTEIEEIKVASDKQVEECE